MLQKAANNCIQYLFLWPWRKSHLKSKKRKQLNLMYIHENICVSEARHTNREKLWIFFNILYWIGSPLLNMQKWTLKRSWGCNVLSTWMQRPISPCSLSPWTACLIFHEADLFSAPSALGSSGLLIFPCSQFFCPCSQELIAHSSSLSSAKLVIYLQWCSHCNITLQSPLVVSPKNCTIII